MSEALDDVFGWELLQVGTGVHARLCWQAVGPAPCRGRKSTRAAWRRGYRGRLSQLPIANGAVDAVVLPHTSNSRRIRTPWCARRIACWPAKGSFIVLGFRRAEPMGFRSRAISRGYPPGLKRMLGARRVARLARASGIRRIVDA